MAERTPSDLARETLKQLAIRRLPPTPNHYREIYDEIAGMRSAQPFPEGPFRQILRVVPGQTPVQRRLLDQFEKAVSGQDWSALQSVMVGYAKLGLSDSAVADTTNAAKTLAALPPDLAEQLARLVENTLAGLSTDDSKVHLLGGQLVQFLRAPSPPASTLQLMLANFSFRLSFAAEDQAAVRSLLLELLHMVFENMAALSVDDRWLSGQTEALVQATSQPLTLRRLDDVQRRLKDVIFKQTEAKGRMVEAQEQMKEMLSAFIERLGTMTETSGAFHETMEDCAEKIAAASSLEDIAPVLKQVMGATRSMALDSRMAHDELHQLRQRAQDKHAEIAQLQQTLDQVSKQARHDPLTGSLNRKGLDEALQREIARGRRAETPLCIALLDVDNFKQINDRLGHATGDEALVHLANVVRSVMRPQDMLARYGGEEFIVVLPDTLLASGVEAMQRLQRELTKNFFLKDNEKLLITFSAGVAQLSASEESPEAIKRADQAMYLAKRQGKNRVVAA